MKAADYVLTNVPSAIIEEEAEVRIYNHEPHITRILTLKGFHCLPTNGKRVLGERITMFDDVRPHSALCAVTL